MTKRTEEIAAEAYQIIGAIAEEAALWDSPGVQRALDYFGDAAVGKQGERVKGSILPWSVDGSDQ